MAEHILTDLYFLLLKDDFARWTTLLIIWSNAWALDVLLYANMLLYAWATVDIINSCYQVCQGS